MLTVTWITRQVSIELDAALEAEVKVGDPVTITLPDNQTTPGRISYVELGRRPSGQNGGSTIAGRRDPDRSGGDRRSRPGAGQRLDHDRERQQRARRARSTRCSRSRAAATRSRRSAPAACTTWWRSDRPVRRRRRTRPGQRQRASRPGSASWCRANERRGGITARTASAATRPARPGDGGDDAVLELDDVTKTYPARAAGGRARRRSASASTAASWSRSSARPGRASRRCCT